MLRGLQLSSAIETCTSQPCERGFLATVPFMWVARRLMSRVPSPLFASAEQPIPSSLTDTGTWASLARSSTSTEPWRPSGNAYLKQFVDDQPDRGRLRTPHPDVLAADPDRDRAHAPVKIRKAGA